MEPELLNLLNFYKQNAPTEPTMVTFEMEVDLKI